MCIVDVVADNMVARKLSGAYFPLTYDSPSQYEYTPEHTQGQQEMVFDVESPAGIGAIGSK